MIIDVYVDGSYFTSDPTKTFGGVIAVKNKRTPREEVIMLRRVISERKEFVTSRNAGGELIAALTGIIDGCSICGEDTTTKSIINIYYDFKGVREFVTGNYSARKQGPILYVGCVENVLKANPNVELKFHKVVAHSGDKYNSIADSIAKGVIPAAYQKYQKDTIII